MTSVSVVICSYNDGDVLPTAIRSVLVQTLSRSEYELVIVDDGSDDGTPRVVSEYATAEPVRFVRNETNRGLVAAANRGLRLADGEYVVRLDADDVFAPSALSHLLRAVDSAEANFAYPDRLEIDERGSVTYVDTGDPIDVFRLIAIGTLFKRDIALEIGGYRDLFWEEYDFYIRYLDESGLPPVHVPRPLAVYHQHGESMTSDCGRVRAGWDELVEQWGEERLSRYGTLPSDVQINEP